MRKELADSKTKTRYTRILRGIRNRHFFVLDLLVSCITPVIAFWLRTDRLDSAIRIADALALYTLLAIIVRVVVFLRFGLYSRYWRYASVEELLDITAAVVTATSITALVFLGILQPLVHQLEDVPRSIPVIDGILILLAVGALRYSVRVVERVSQRRQDHREKGTRVMVIGAGDAGMMIVREIHANPQLGLEPVVFIDDDPRKRGARINGVPVIGGRQVIGEAAKRYRVQQAIIAMPTEPGKTIRELTRLCQEAKIAVKTVPGMYELLDGSVTVDQLRPVEISDLLRREQVVTDMSAVAGLLTGRRVLVTGAGGSIGSELCRQTARCNPSALVLLGHGENSLFHAANEFRLAYPQLNLLTIVADIRNLERMQSVFERLQPEVVFHAAAHKHVPLMEENVEDAVTNNVLGTRNLLRVAQASGVERFVLISTDKAVNPTSIMGATKRVAELLVEETARRTDGCFVAVRFGNVLDSRGSVIRVFKKQIAQGGPLTVTHPDVRRYFMTIPEAVQLVLQAAALGLGGEIFVLDMGEPVRIVDLARDLIRLSGLREGQDIDIVFTGLRQGEKLFEELFISGEKYARTAHEKIFVVRNGTTEVSVPNLQSSVDALIAAAQAGDVPGIQCLLQSLVPEYQPIGAAAEPNPLVASQI